MNQNSNAWSHLPNAAHIDAIIESVAQHTDIWTAAWGAAWGAAWEAAKGDARIAARTATRTAAWGAARISAMSAAEYAAGYAARDPIMALIAYDDAAKYLSMTSDELRMWCVLGEQPAAILMLLAVIAYEQINQLETV